MTTTDTTAGWQPAMTAPKDGMPFRAYGPTLVHLDFNPQGSVEACFDGERFIGAVWDGQHDVWRTDFIEFTHWMPLPEAPTGAEKKVMEHKSLAQLPWSRYPLRTCRSLHHCEMCSRDITMGERYRDGGYSRRAHETCVMATTEAPTGGEQ